ncbi:MAG: hypothetical protein JJE17_10520 [Peptostreptococcaceae bacterium]|nr:hypothetical protein [Peptostreptococcaceae bacterium]
MYFSDKVKFIKNRLRLANQVRLSTRFLWNTRSKQGCVQLKATVTFMAENNLFEISHNFEWNDFGQNRSSKIVSNIEKQIDKDNTFHPLIGIR